MLVNSLQKKKTLIAASTLMAAWLAWSLQPHDTADRAENSPNISHQRQTKLEPIEWNKNALVGPLCGLQAAVTALSMIGVECDAGNFLTTRYISTKEGSTPDEVAAIVRDMDAQAWVINGLSAIELCAIECPLIANVRSNAIVDQYNHWVVAVPCNNGFMIYDGSQKPFELAPAEFFGL